MKRFALRTVAGLVFAVAAFVLTAVGFDSARSRVRRRRGARRRTSASG